MKKAFFFAIAVIILYVVGVFVFWKDDQPSWITNAPLNVNSFTECAAATGVVQESYPRRCIINGLTFTEDIGNELEMIDVIQVDSPRPNDIIASPLSISGRARGSWFFEAQAPVELLDGNQEIITQGTIHATGDWQTENFVDFTADLTFVAPDTDTGTLVFKNDNPSGLPQNEKQLTIPVTFTSLQ